MYLWRAIGTTWGTASAILSSANPGRFREYNLNSIYMLCGCIKKVKTVCSVWEKMNGGDKPNIELHLTSDKGRYSQGTRQAA